MAVQTLPSTVIASGTLPGDPFARRADHQVDVIRGQQRTAALDGSKVCRFSRKTRLFMCASVPFAPYVTFYVIHNLGVVLGENSYLIPLYGAQTRTHEAFALDAETGQLSGRHKLLFIGLERVPNIWSPDLGLGPRNRPGRAHRSEETTA